MVCFGGWFVLVVSTPNSVRWVSLRGQNEHGGVTRLPAVTTGLETHYVVKKREPNQNDETHAHILILAPPSTCRIEPRLQSSRKKKSGINLPAAASRGEGRRTPAYAREGTAMPGIIYARVPHTLFLLAPYLPRSVIIIFLVSPLPFSSPEMRR